MANFDTILGTWFGKSPDAEIAQGMKALAGTAFECAVLLRATRGLDYKGIIDLEHMGDDLKEVVVNSAESAFISIYNKNDVGECAKRIDLILNGCRKVVELLRIWGSRIGDLSPEAVSLLEKVELMTGLVRDLAAMLCEKSPPRDEAVALVKRLDEIESEADEIRVTVEEKLANDPNSSSTDPVTLLKRIDLYDMLEGVTDAANHCGPSILRMLGK